MKRAEKKASNKLVGIIIALTAVVVIVAGFIFFNPFGGGKSSSTAKKSTSTSSTKQAAKYEPSQEEKDYLSKRFSDLSKTNKEVVGYIYAPGTDLDEPVVPN